MLFFVALCTLYVSYGMCGLAPTWDSCGCYWEDWAQWSACSKTCGGGSRNRDRSVTHWDLPECDGFDKCASNDMGWDYSGCNAFCQNGGTFTVTYSYNGYCACPDGKTGTCCEQTVNCGLPSSVSNGQTIGADYNYSSQIRYVCDPGFNMTDRTAAVRTCTKWGYWDNTLPQCLYAESCSSNPCQNAGTCLNELGYYTCFCAEGWDGYDCDIDIQPPVMSPPGCSQSLELFTSNMAENVTWVEPIFRDPLGFEVVVTQNYPISQYNFPWGIFTVFYSAVKPSNGLWTECAFDITVKPNPCGQLTSPTNGILACNGWNNEFANVCKYYCLDNYTFPIGFSGDTILTCGASGLWLPASNFTGCISEEITPLPRVDINTFPGCETTEERFNISSKYILDLKHSSFNALCVDYQEDCHEDNVFIEC